MHRIGWFTRLCIVLSLWWLPIGTVLLMNVELSERNRTATAFSDLCYRGVDGFPADKISAEMERCYQRSQKDFGKIEADMANMWWNNVGMAFGFCVAGWAVAWLLYWSARFVLAGRRA